MAEALKELHSAAKDGKYVFSAGDGEPMGLIKTVFSKARAGVAVPAKCRIQDLRHRLGSGCPQFGMIFMTFNERQGHCSVTTSMRSTVVGGNHKRRALGDTTARWNLDSDKIGKTPFQTIVDSASSPENH